MNTSVVVVVVIIVALAVLALLRSAKKPKERTFRCARCSATAQHSPRTIDAWRKGKTKFFCDACHAQWLRSQPLHVAAARSTGSGCLGAFLVLIALPITLLLVWVYF